MRGRKPKPKPELRLITGGVTRLGAFDESPQPPDWLTPEAQAEWRRVIRDLVIRETLARASLNANFSKIEPGGQSLKRSAPKVPTEPMPANGSALAGRPRLESSPRRVDGLWPNPAPGFWIANRSATSSE